MPIMVTTYPIYRLMSMPKYSLMAREIIEKPGMVDSRREDAKFATLVVLSAAVAMSSDWKELSLHRKTKEGEEESGGQKGLEEGFCHGERREILI
jgi:hypothetical protein